MKSAILVIFLMFSVSAFAKRVSVGEIDLSPYGSTIEEVAANFLSEKCGGRNKVHRWSENDDNGFYVEGSRGIIIIYAEDGVPYSIDSYECR